MFKSATENLKKSENPDIRAQCGFHCSSCPAYKGNIKDDNDRNRVHMGWKKIYGLDIPPEAMKCDGCQKPDAENPFRIGGDCPIRNCAVEKEILHCGLCNDFPCDLMKQHLESVEKVIPGCRDSCSPEEFRDFVEPYLCRAFLENSGK